MYIYLAVAVWLLCGVLAHGLMFAYRQREYPTYAESERGADFKHSAVVIPFGAIYLAAAVLALMQEGRAGFRHGFMFYRRAGAPLWKDGER